MPVARVAVLIAGSLAILTGCGSSNSTLSYSAFSDAANKICIAADSQTKAAGHLSPAGTAADVSKLNKVASIVNDSVSKLNALKGPSALVATRDTYVADLKAVAAKLGDAASAAKAGDQAGYKKTVLEVPSVTSKGKAEGSKLGAAKCAS
jgi:hypothetical protein